jgi:hypothetical protein
VLEVVDDDLFQAAIHARNIQSTTASSECVRSCLDDDLIHARNRQSATASSECVRSCR